MSASKILKEDNNNVPVHNIIHPYKIYTRVKVLRMNLVNFYACSPQNHNVIVGIANPFVFAETIEKHNLVTYIIL